MSAIALIAAPRNLVFSDVAEAFFTFDARGYGSLRSQGRPVEVHASQLVMPGLVPGIHVFLFGREQDVDGRDKPGHDER